MHHREMTSDRSGAATRFSEAPTRRDKPTTPRRQARVHEVAEGCGSILQVQRPEPALDTAAAVLLGAMIQRAVVSARQDGEGRPSV